MTGQEGLNTDTDARYRERYIAFLDLLGFRWIVDESTRDLNAFRAAQSALEAAENECESSLLLAGYGAVEGGDSRQVYMFSDSVLVTGPATDNGLADVFEVVANISKHLIYGSVFLRGAIVRGDLYERGHVVFGPGLIKAYDLESTVAWYPRVIVSDEIVRMAGQISYQPRGRDPMSLRHRLCQDVDGRWFLDWLCHYHAIYEPGTKGLRLDSPINFAAIKSIVAWSLEEFQGNPRVHAKTSWFANYFNRILLEGRELNILGAHSDLAAIPIDDKPPSLTGDR